MPVVALVLFAVFGLLGFGWRSWLQRRRTGSTGFHGVSGRVGSVEWFAGVGFVVAMAAAVFAPALQLAGLVSPLSFLHAPWIQLTGIVLAVVGIAATVYAQIDMGDSWRIGVDPTETTTLVRQGVFGFVRNPIFHRDADSRVGYRAGDAEHGGNRRIRAAGADDRGPGARRRRALPVDQAR